MKVLFVGNSHTYFNDMPELFARFAEKTTGEKPEVVMLAYGGRDYDWHFREFSSLRFNLMYGGYDYCVLQQAAHPYPLIENTLKTGWMLIDLCHRCGVKPVVYMTWAEKRSPENQQKMIDTCEKLAEDNNALLAPIGLVWQEVQRTRPDIELYHTDGEHASPYGDFLIAAVFCKLLTGSISPDVSGMGFNFHVNDETGRNTVNKSLIPTGLDQEKTDWILGLINR